MRITPKMLLLYFAVEVITITIAFVVASAIVRAVY